MDYSNKELRIAIHEAGHAVAGILLDFPLDSDRIHLTKKNNASGKVSMNNKLLLSIHQAGIDHDLMEKQLVILLSGEMAEMVLAGKKQEAKEVNEDHEQVIKISLILTKGKEQEACIILDRCFDKSRALIEGNSNSIRDISLELLKKKTISVDYIKDLLKENGDLS